MVTLRRVPHMRRLALFALTIVPMIFVTHISAARADESYPEPTVQDVCGTTYDTYTIPINDGYDSGTFYVVDGVAKTDANHGGGAYSTNGSLSITVDVEDSNYNRVAGPWTLAWTNTKCGKQAPMRMTFKRIACEKDANNSSTVAVTVRNPADSTGLPFRMRGVEFEEVSQFVGGYQYPPIDSSDEPTIPDGSSLTFYTIENDYSNDDRPELDQGLYNVTLRDSHSRIVDTQFYVSRQCNGKMPNVGARGYIAGSGKNATFIGNEKDVLLQTAGHYRIAGTGAHFHFIVRPKTVAKYSCNNRSKRSLLLPSSICSKPHAHYKLEYEGISQEYHKSHWFILDRS